MENMLNVVNRSPNSDGQGLRAELIEKSRIPDSCHSTDADELVSSASAGPLAAAFKAVGHPVRLQILELLALRSDPVCACDIESRFSLSQPTISHHLRVLRKAGLVTGERRGTWIYYSVSGEGIRPISSFLRSLSNHSGESEYVSQN